MVDKLPWNYGDLPTPVTKQEHIDLAGKVFNERNEWIVGTDWIKVSEKNGYTLEELEIPGSSFKAYKSSGNLYNVDIDILTKLLYNPEFKDKKLIANDLVFQETLKSWGYPQDAVNGNINTCIAGYSTPWGVSSREFVVLRALRTYEDGSRFIVIQSINDDKVPSRCGYVRGVSNCAILLKRIDETTIHITNINHVDPKGYVPGFLIDMFKDRQYRSLENLQKFYGTK